MNLLETVMAMFLMGSPFGGVSAVTFEASQPDPNIEYVIVKLHTDPPIVLGFNEDLEYTILEGQELVECQHENGEEL